LRFIRPGREQAAEVQRARRERGAGVSTEAPTPAPRITLGDLAESSSVVIRNGRHQGARFLLKESRVHLGSHPGLAEIVLDDPGISNVHARLERVLDDAQSCVFLLADAGSANGTSVDGVHLSQDEGLDGLEVTVPLRARSTFVLDGIELALMPAGRLAPSGAWESVEEAKRTIAAEAARHAAASKVEATAFAAPLRTGGESPGSALAPPRAAPPPPRPLRAVFQPSLRDVWLQPTALITHGARVSRHHLPVTGVLGQNPYQAHLRIDEDHVSGAHARWTLTVGGFGQDVTLMLEDLQSTNGLLPREAAPLHERQPVVLLHPNDTIWIGPHVQLTLLAPGFVKDGVFIACDASGRPLRAPRSDASRPSTNPRMIAALPNVVVYALMVLFSVALYFVLDRFVAPILSPGAAP
jgi:pSer/pThr/pTyr-binding forkhead associated (FHA) protein